MLLATNDIAQARSGSETKISEESKQFRIRRGTNEIKTDLSGAGVQLKSTRNSFGLLRYCNFRLSMGRECVWK